MHPPVITSRFHILNLFHPIYYLTSTFRVGYRIACRVRMEGLDHGRPLPSPHLIIVFGAPSWDS